MTFGVPRMNPTEYARQNYDLVPTVQFNRAPLSTDVNFQVQTIWRVGEDPTTGVTGDQWIMASKTGSQGSQVATWRQFSFGGGGGDVNSVSGDDSLPVVASGGNIGFTGEVVANGTNAQPVAFIKNSTSVEGLEVQVASASSSSILDNAGLASFNSTNFSVDENGFVTPIPFMFASNGMWYLANDINNVTGNNTQYQIIFDTNDYQNGTDVTYNFSTGVFTFNTSGVYQIGWALGFKGVTAEANNLEAFISSGANVGGIIYDNPGVNYDANTFDGLTYFVNVQKKITAPLGVSCKINIQGQSSNLISLQGNLSSQLYNYFYYNRIA